MWESRVCCGISKRGGNGGKVGVGLFHGFQGASFPQPSSGFGPFWAKMPPWATAGASIMGFSKAAPDEHFSKILRRAHFCRVSITSLSTVIASSAERTLAGRVVALVRYRYLYPDRWILRLSSERAARKPQQSSPRSKFPRWRYGFHANVVGFATGPAYQAVHAPHIRCIP